MPDTPVAAVVVCMYANTAIVFASSESGKHDTINAHFSVHH